MASINEIDKLITEKFKEQEIVFENKLSKLKEELYSKIKDEITAELTTTFEKKISSIKSCHQEQIKNINIELRNAAKVINDLQQELNKTNSNSRWQKDWKYGTRGIIITK